jgi:hypothetical protein
MPNSSRFQNARVLPRTVLANGRVNLNVGLACSAPQSSRPSARATATAFSRPAMASIRVSIIGMDAVMPVVVATFPSTTKRRFAT